jgi:hypothetical protein
VAGDYQVKVTRDVAGYDDYGLPRVARSPAARVVIVAAQREMVFGSRDALERFVEACRRAGDEAFGSSSSSSDPLLDSPQIDHAAAWCRFYDRVLKF